MSYEMKPLSCDPTAIGGMSEELITSHYETIMAVRCSVSMPLPCNLRNSILLPHRSLS